jgi:RNA polymerase sigma-70 factor (ECF subfamily)
MTVLLMNLSGTDRLNLFAKLMVEHHSRLYRYVRMIVPDQDNAEDVLQETLMVLWQKFDETYSERSFYAWASRTAHFIALRERRSAKRQAHVLDPEILDQLAAEELGDTESLAQLKTLLEACMAQLPASDRELIRARYQPGVAVGAIAERLKRPLASVSKSLGRIRRALLKCLRQRAALQVRDGDRRLP